MTTANRFSGLTYADKVRMYTGFRKSVGVEYKHNLTDQMDFSKVYENYYVDEQDRKIAFPTKVDWRVRGATSVVRDQAACGSCWAFSTAAAIEQRLNILINDTERPHILVSE